VDNRWLKKHAALTDIGYREHDRRTNDDLRIMLQNQTIGASIRTTGMMSSYHSGIMTEKFLHCSDTRNEVNHGIVIVGYGTNEGERVYGNTSCEDYFIIRNSWGSHWGEKGFFKLCADGLGST
tara:strand:+ start:557 stop:925 length:369 start_codon:yes stop_codon:yes gene_type:complete